MMANPYPYNKVMNRHEFTEALKNGLGRAKLQILNNGLDEYADLVLYVVTRLLFILSVFNSLTTH